MRVLGIDPGYAIVGWGVVDYAGNRFAPVDFGAVCTDAGVPFERRLDEVYAGIKEVIERTRPEVLAIEKLFYQHNQTTVIGVAEARGVILLAAAQAGLPIYEYTPMQVKQAVTIPVIVAGRMDSPRLASDAVRSGKCDFIALGRPSLADPDLPNKLAAGQTSQIRPCISCNYGCCTKVHQTSGRAGCSVNPQCANELRTRLLPAVEPKRIAVIGGGPGGCECARVLALRGHTVTLFERQPRLGGALIPASSAGFKHHDAALIAYYENELSRLGVDVRTGTPADADCVAALSPDVVVVATGARPNIPQIPGIDRALTAEDALTDPSAVGQSAVIFGTGLVGVETALWMLELGKAVTLIGRSDRFMPKALYSDAEHARALLRFRGATLMSETAVEEIGDGWVRVRRKGSAPEHLDADTFICAAGYRSDDTVYQVMRAHFPIVYNIGDSAAARNIYAAVHEAYELASNL